MRLQFTDILGATKNVEVPDRQFEEALDGRIMFDGSSIEGFVRIEESDMYLKPDLEHLPGVPVDLRRLRARRRGSSATSPTPTARRSPAARAPRSSAPSRWRREKGFAMRAGPEAEFFLFQRRANGEPTTETHDSGGYFDLTPVDLGEDVRREIVLALEQMGFHVEAAHHEVAPGQHEIDFRYDDALIDGRQRQHVPLRREERGQPQRPARDVHAQAGLRHQRQRHAHAPVAVRGRQERCSTTRRREWQLSRTCLHYIGGLLRHAKAFCAITNPLVNSYKRLVPGLRGADGDRVVRAQPQPAGPRAGGARRRTRASSCACPTRRAIRIWRSRSCCARGSTASTSRADPGPPVNKNIYKMSHRERRHLRIDELPGNLSEALDELEKSELMRDTLGDHIFDHFLTAKRAEWDSYIRQVSPVGDRALSEHVLTRPTLSSREDAR